MADIEPCGRILYDAFHGIATQHGFPPDFPSLEDALQFAAILVPGRAFGIVAEQNGRVVGSNFLAESDAIRGVGPISVDPSLQGSGVGRELMKAVIERAKGAAGIRLLQDAFNSRSMSLYASLGFEVKEPLVMVKGRPRSAGEPVRGRVVRALRTADVDACVALCRRVHGFGRASEMSYAGPMFESWVVERAGRIVAYGTGLHFWAPNHGVAETEEDMRALILGFAREHPEPVWFLLPTRQASFFRWCLSEGLRVIKPMTLMAMGEYHDPAGCWIPSVMY
jgi:GNAT superfamily N-acetyltransferase